MRTRFLLAAGTTVLAHAPAWGAAQTLAAAEDILKAEGMYRYSADLATAAEPGLRLGMITASAHGGAGRVPFGLGVDRTFGAVGAWVHLQPRAALAGAKQSFLAALHAWPNTMNGLSAAGFFVLGDLVAQVFEPN
jgi:hypothetical protein